MDYYHISLLAVIQGLSEFIPVSSSAHLALLPLLTTMPEADVFFQVILHVGTLLAICFYFYRHLGSLIQGAWSLCRGQLTPFGHLGVKLVLATLPAVMGGYLIFKYLPPRPDSLRVIGMASILFGLALGIVDRRAGSQQGPGQAGSLLQDPQAVTYRQALAIGMAQVLALLIPGASRSGCCLTVARSLGLSRPLSVEFSFLLAIPTTVGAAVLMLCHLPPVHPPLPQLGFALGLTALVGVGAVFGIMRWIQHYSLTPFMVYRVLLGGGLLLIERT